MNPSESQPLVHDDSEEVVQVVDLDDNPVGSATRKDVREKHLPHRATYVILENENNGKIYIHKRSMLKKWCPGYWDIGFGGVVAYQESYENGAKRELLEEAGVEEPLIPLFKFIYNVPPSIPLWAFVFYAKTKKDLILQKEEVDEVDEKTIDELRTIQTKDGCPFAFDAQLALQLFLNDYDSKYSELIQKSKQNE